MTTHFITSEAAEGPEGSTFSADGVAAYFRKQAMPFLTVNSIIGNQAFQNGRCYICSSLGLDKVETDFNLLMELKCTHQMLNFSYSHWLLAVSFYLLFGATLSLRPGLNVAFYMRRIELPN